MTDIDGRQELIWEHNNEPSRNQFELFRGEKEAIDIVLKAGRTYGYGNMIARLKEAWIKMLMDDYHLVWENAKVAADCEPSKPPEVKK